MIKLLRFKGDAMIYDGFASVYDHLMTDTPYDEWYKNLMSLYNKYAMKGKDILDLACGTGAMTLRLSKAGYKVLGIDLSETMLEIAQQRAFKENLKARFIQQDMTELNLFHPYDSVISYCDGFNYILDEKKLENTLKLVHKYLKKDGLLVFDMSSSYKLKHILGQNVFTETGDSPYIWENYYDNETKILEFDLTIFVGQGNQYKRFDEIHKQRAYEINQILEIMIKSGFDPLEILDTNAHKQVTETTERWLFVGRKINE